MLYTTSEDVFAIFDEEQARLCEDHREEIVVNPDRDFTRKTKLTIPTLMNFIIASSAEGLKPNMLDFKDSTGEWHEYTTPPYISAVSQARKKLKPEAFEMLFGGVTSHLLQQAVWENDPGCDYHLLLRRVDGTSLPYDSSSKYSDESYSARGTRAWAQECTIIDDLDTGMFTDAMVHGVKGKGTGEPSDFCRMIDRANVPEGTRVLYIADRAYATANVMAHVQESGQFFLIRSNDLDSAGFASSFRLPEGAFDIDLEVKIGRSVPHLWEPDDHHRSHCLSASTQFDYIEPESWKTYMLHLRVIRQKIGDTWVVLLTNLPRDRYTLDDVMRFYGLRWGIEVSFRDWKYTLGTLSFHSRLDKLITQEIWAKLLLFNMCTVVTASAPKVVLDAAEGHEVPKYARVFVDKGPDRVVIDFVEAVHAIRIDFLSRKETSVNLAHIIIQYKDRIRPGRHEPHNIRPRRRFYLNYRAA